MVLRLCCALFLFNSTASHAADWRVLGRTNDGEVTTVDVASIGQVPGRKRAWFQVKTGTGVLETKSLQQADCNANTLVVEAAVKYAPDGSALASFTEHNEYLLSDGKAVVPDSIGETMFNFICSYPIGLNPSMLAMERESSATYSYYPRRRR